MDPNGPYYLNLLVMLALLLVGAAAGYYTAKQSGQQAALRLKNELITDLSRKVDQLEKKVDQLEKDKEQLQSTIDDLVAMEDARKRNAQRNGRPAVKISASVKAESEDAK